MSYRCEPQQYGETFVNVCKISSNESGAGWDPDDSCEDNFDCGFSALEGRWSECGEGVCRIMME